LQQEGTWDSREFKDDFVRVEDGEFVIGENSARKFPISGFNIWEVVEAASLPEGGPVELPGSGQLPNDLKSGKEFVTKALDDAIDAGYTVVRAWAHGVTEEYQSMDARGNINERVMSGLDYFMAEAYKRGLKVILSFTSNWTPAGGVDFYAEAVGKEHNDFFSDPGAKELYKKFVEQVVTRKNTIRATSYSEDPTIFAWNLINEPVCRGCEAGTIARWVNEMAPYVKGLDSNHFLTV
jgi:mannan endo-1,4-beta-mannosidase